MTIPKLQAPLATVAMPVQAKLAAAWASLMFLYIYVDYYHLYQPGILDDIQAGLVFEFEISPPLMTAFLALLAVPSLMITLSVVLPAQANRIANLLVAALYIPVTAFNAVGESWEWAPFYVLSIGVELLLLAFILRASWAWPRIPAAAPVPVDEIRR
ncbi:DUF6326 family protein [Microbacterium aurum]